MVTDIKMEDYDFNNEIDDDQKFDLEEDQHICLICNTTFTLQEDLLRHVAAKHNIKFECIACNELFISNMELKVKILNREVDSNRTCQRTKESTQLLVYIFGKLEIHFIVRKAIQK